MPSIKNATEQKPKPFINLPELTILTLRDGNRITGFDVTYKGKKKTFKVTQDKEESAILKCFMEVEKFVK